MESAVGMTLRIAVTTASGATTCMWWSESTTVVLALGYMALIVSLSSLPELNAPKSTAFASGLFGTLIKRSKAIWPVYGNASTCDSVRWISLISALIVLLKNKRLAARV